MHFANVIVDSKWQANIHGVEKHEAWKDWKGGGLVRMDSKVGSWFINTNHKQFFNYYVLSGFAIIPQNCDCKDEVVNTITT
jgi:hypothetical protein